MEQISEQTAPITSDDQTIRDALEHADIASLMCALIHLTGDLGIIRSDIRPTLKFLDPDDGLTDAQREHIRQVAFEALVAHRDNPKPFYTPNDSEIREMLNFLADAEVSDEYSEFLTEELSMQGEDAFVQPEIFKIPEAQRADFKVLVIGAGMSGLLSAIRLKEAGIAFEIAEKNSDVGGTWYENTYPGCRVDSANHVYSYSFRPQDWPQHFSQQAVLKQYFSETADEYELRPFIRFDTEVKTARFDESLGIWSVTVQTADGSTETIEANAVISAVGQLNRPNKPEINGADTYSGITFHSAEWEHQHDLTGKKIGVIGSGASAFQFVPIIAETAESVTVFQRTAPWVIPNPDYFQDVPTGKHWLLQYVPFYNKWFRFSVFWRGAEGLLDAVKSQDGWNRPEESVGPENQELRDALVASIQEQLAGRDDLIEKCTPNYPVGAKRALIDDGRYYQSLRRDNVELNTDGIEEITSTGLQTRKGDEYEFDVLIYATGFKASSFLFPMEVYGKDGKELQQVWDGEPQAYKGISVPGFPNFFCCYGPNTNIVVNGAIIFFSECEVRYILGCLALLMQKNGKALDVKQAAHDEYNEWIDAGTQKMAWGQSNVNTWYKNANGKITQNWPFTMLEFWQQSRFPDENAYVVK